MIKGIRDVSIAVHDLDVAMEDFKAKLGLEPRYIQEEGRPPVQVRTALYSLGGAGLSLMASSEEGSPIDRFLKRRGEGLFSVTVEVEDIKAAVAEMRAFKSHDGMYARALMNFTRPHSTHGVVFEVQQLVR